MPYAESPLSSVNYSFESAQDYIRGSHDINPVAMEEEKNDTKPDTYNSDTTTTTTNMISSSPKAMSPVDGRFDLAATKPQLEETIPPTNEHRTIVLCFDGTGDQFDDDNSNVVNLFSLLKKDDPKRQLVYYQAGIGTYSVPQVANPFMARTKKLIDAMIGVHLNAHVMGGYEYLMQHYEEGDKICIFGFSRGAYTARALGGMIHKVGLLPRGNHNQIPFAYRMYSRRDENSWQQSAAFKIAFSIDVDIELIGVWDTVGSVGVIPRRLPFTTSNTHVKHFRHAVALDERRVRFMPNFWRHTHQPRGVGQGEMPKSRPKPGREKTLKELEREYSVGGDHLTEVEEVWFAGCHCDVGGGSVRNGTRHNLARIPLRWMIRQCFQLNTGILFHRELLWSVGLDPDTLYPYVKPRPEALRLNDKTKQDLNLAQVRSSGKEFMSEEHEDLADALCPTYDQLTISKVWWLLEILPQKIQKWQLEDGSWARKHGLNWGHPRTIPRQKKRGIKVHRSVQVRMEAEAEALPKKKKYIPKSKWEIEPKWVD